MQDNQRQAVLYAYLAGIIDGEGTIRIGKSLLKRNPNWNPRYYASIACGMVNREVPELLARTFGANVRIERVSNKNRQDIYRWGTSGNIAIPKILKKIFPYLIVKRKQAELVLQFCEMYNSGRASHIRKCQKCERIIKISAYGLCAMCRKQEYKAGTISRFKHNKNAGTIIDLRLQRREELYLKVKKLNAVGAAAETK